MKLMEDADVIANHAFKSNQNLRLALKVVFAFPAIKERIIKEFVLVFVRRLKSRLGKTWIVVDEWSEAPLERYSDVAATKSAWNGNSIGLHCSRLGPSYLSFYVSLEKKQKSALIAEMKESLEERYAHGNSSSIAPWWKFVDPPYRDWKDEEALLRLWKKEEAVEYYVSHLLKICKIAGPFLDKMSVK